MKVTAWVIVLLSMILLQWHSINTWIKFSDSITGSLMSVLIEVVALWFWYNRNIVLAPLTSAFVICFALYHLGDKVINDSEAKAKKEIVDKKEKLLMSVIEKVKEEDWPITLQKSLASLESIGKQKDEAFTIDKSKWITIFLLGFVLVLIQIGQIKAMISLRPERVTLDDAKPKKKEVKQAVTPLRNKTVDSSIQVLADKTLGELQGFMDRNNIDSETLTRKLLGLDAPTFSRLRTAYKNGTGISEIKMNMILERIKNYEKR